MEDTIIFENPPSLSTTPTFSCTPSLQRAQLWFKLLLLHKRVGKLILPVAGILQATSKDRLSYPWNLLHEANSTKICFKLIAGKNIKMGFIPLVIPLVTKSLCSSATTKESCFVGTGSPKLHRRKASFHFNW